MRMNKIITIFIGICIFCMCFGIKAYAETDSEQGDQLIFVDSIEDCKVIEVDELDGYMRELFNNVNISLNDNIEVKLLSSKSRTIECNGYDVEGKYYYATYSVWVNGIDVARFTMGAEWSCVDGKSAFLKEISIGATYLNPYFTATNNNDCQLFYNHVNEEVFLTHSFKLTSATYNYNKNIKMYIYLSIYGDFRVAATEI